MAKGKVTFDVERCKSCGLCVEACPKEIVISLWASVLMIILGNIISKLKEGGSVD